MRFSDCLIIQLRRKHCTNVHTLKINIETNYIGFKGWNFIMYDKRFQNEWSVHSWAEDFHASPCGTPRPDGACKCRDNYDGHEYLLYHTGGGKMVDYVTLQSCVLSMVNGGTTQYAFHKTIKDNCESLGNCFSCNYQTFLEASDSKYLHFWKERFSSHRCGKYYSNFIEN